MTNPIGYFQFDDEDFSIAMVLKVYWEKHGFMDGNGIDDKLIPAGFFELTESCYETDISSIEEAKSVLIAAGWEEKFLFP